MPPVPFPELLSSGFIEEEFAEAVDLIGEESFLSFSAQASLRNGGGVPVPLQARRFLSFSAQASLRSGSGVGGGKLSGFLSFSAQASLRRTSGAGPTRQGSRFLSFSAQASLRRLLPWTMPLKKIWVS